MSKAQSEKQKLRLPPLKINPAEHPQGYLPIDQRHYRLPVLPWLIV
jgi:hypothetical protein